MRTDTALDPSIQRSEHRWGERARELDVVRVDVQEVVSHPAPWAEGEHLGVRGLPPSP